MDASIGGGKKNQVSIIRCHAWEKSLEFVEELESKFGNFLNEREDGVNQIISFLEEHLECNNMPKSYRS